MRDFRSSSFRLSTPASLQGCPVSVSNRQMRPKHRRGDCRIDDHRAVGGIALVARS